FLKLTGAPVIALPLPREHVLRPAPVRPPRRVPRIARGAARVALGSLVGAILGLLAWAGVVVIQGGNEVTGQVGPKSVAQRAASAAPTAPRPSVAALAVPAGDSLVAEARAGRVNVYPSSGAKHPELTLSNPNPEGASLVFLVATYGQHRMRVLLPTRPNLSQGWIARSDVRLALDPYRVQVQLSHHLMTVWRSGRVAERDKVGVGRRAVTPTP